MFLNNYIGENIFVNLRQGTERNTVLNYFYSTDSVIYNKLIDVDELGLWLEGFGTMTKLLDDAGKEIPDEQQVSEQKSTSVLIRWEYIDNVYVLNDGDKKENLMGFRFVPRKD